MLDERCMITRCACLSVILKESYRFFTFDNVALPILPGAVQITEENEVNHVQHFPDEVLG